MDFVGEWQKTCASGWSGKLCDSSGGLQKHLVLKCSASIASAPPEQSEANKTKGFFNIKKDQSHFITFEQSIRTFGHTISSKYINEIKTLVFILPIATRTYSSIQINAQIGSKCDLSIN